MTKRQFVVLAFRLLSLYLCFNLLQNIGYLFNMISAVDHATGRLDLQAILTSAFGIVVGLWIISLLWKKSEWLMVKIFAIPSLSDDVKLVKEEEIIEGQVEGVSESIPSVIEIQDYYETPLSKESVELIAFSVVGLLVFFNHLPHLLRDFNIDSAPFLSFNPTFSLTILIPDVIQVGLALWLFLRPWQFQAWVGKFKPKPDETEITS